MKEHCLKSYVAMPL